MIEPRERPVWRPRALIASKAALRESAAPPGSKSTARERDGSHGNLGDPALPPHSRFGNPVGTTLASMRCVRLNGERTTDEGGTAGQAKAEPEREERKGVGAPRSTDEVGELTHEEPVEGRGRRSMELLEGKHVGTSSPSNVSTKQQRIAKLAKEEKRALTTLAHHIDIEWLEEAFRRTRKDGATGTDGVTASEYGTQLRTNLQRLLDRAKSGTYRAPAVRRVFIPKGDGQQVRPIGIPTFEDKVLQRAVHMVLEPVYEQEFHDCSYGFRPGRSAHQALGRLREQMMRMEGGWLLEVDIKSFFDTLDHQHLQELLRRRVRDGVLLRLIVIEHRDPRESGPGVVGDRDHQAVAVVV